MDSRITSSAVHKYTGIITEAEAKEYSGWNGRAGCIKVGATGQVTAKERHYAESEVELMGYSQGKKKVWGYNTVVSNTGYLKDTSSWLIDNYDVYIYYGF